MIAGVEGGELGQKRPWIFGKGMQVKRVCNKVYGLDAHCQLTRQYYSSATTYIEAEKDEWEIDDPFLIFDH